MTQRIKIDGQIHEFPDDFTEDDISEALGGTTTPTPAPQQAMRQATDPGFLERLNQRGAEARTGISPAALPENAGFGSKAADIISDIENVIINSGRVAARGVTLGLSDDAAALGTAAGMALSGKPGSFAENYTAADIAENKRIEDFKARNPVIGNTLEIAGLIASPGGAVGANWAAKGGNLATRAFRGGAVGAGQGAVTGLGYSQGDIENRARGAAFGGAFGGAAGTALQPAVELAGRGVGAIRNLATAKANPPIQAQRLMAQALARDKTDPAFLKIQAAQGTGEGLVTMGGPNLVRLGRQATVAPGESNLMAKNLFDTLSEDFPEKLAKSINGLSKDNFFDTVDDLMRARSAASGPAYDLFYKVDPEKFKTPFFDNLVKSKTGQDLLGKAYKIAELERLQGKVPYNVMEGMVDAEGNVPVQKALSPRAVDYLKQAVDQEVQPFINPMTGKIQGPLGYQWDRLRRAVIENADEASTVKGTSLYKLARDAYAGPTALKEAMDFGTKILGGGEFTEAKIRAFQSLSKSEQDAARIGIAQAIREKAGNMGANTDPYQVFLKGTNKKDLLKVVFPDEKTFNRFAGMIERRSKVIGAQRTIMGGSPTASRLAEGESATEDALSSMRDLWNMVTGQGVSGRVGSGVSLVKRTFDKTGNISRGMNEQVADELGGLLFNPSKQGNIEALTRLIGQGGQGLLPPLIAQDPLTQAFIRQLGTGLSSAGARGTGAFIGGLNR